MSTDRLTNAIETLLTPTGTLTDLQSRLSEAESKLADMIKTLIEAAIHANPATNFPIEKQIIDAIISVTVNVLIDKGDQGLFNLITDAQKRRQIDAAIDAAKKTFADKTGASEPAFEHAADDLIHIGGPR